MSKTVFTNGCFDILHPQHFNIFLMCRQLAGPKGHVVVAIDSDKKITEDKGVQRPFFTFTERERNIKMLNDGKKFLVDEVLFFESNKDLLDLVSAIKPDIIVKGSDWINKEVVGSTVCSDVRYVPYDARISTTSIANRIVQKTLQYDFRNEIVGGKIDPFDMSEK